MSGHRLRIERAGVGRVHVSLWLLDPETALYSVLSNDGGEIPLDPHHPWTRAVAMHLAEISGGAIKAAHVLDAVRTAQQAEVAAGWLR